MTNVVIGTSIEAAVGVNSWRERYAARVGLEVLDRSLGAGAYLFPNPTGDTIRKHVDAVIAEFPVPGRVHLAGPYNDLLGLYLEQIPQLSAAVHSADAALRSAGWKVTAGAILPVHGGTATLSENYYQPVTDRRVAYNTDGASYFGARWVDVGGILREARDWWRADSRFYLDGVHPNGFGAALIAEATPLTLFTA